MEYTHLGRTGLEVSRLCLGTMNFGPQASEEDSFRMMDCALEITLSSETLQRLDEIFPGPGGPAPEAYAW